MLDMGRLRRIARRAARVLGYDETNWLRAVQIRSFERFFADRAPLGAVLEISPGWNKRWSLLPARSYTSVDYPDFDITRDFLPERFDFVVADQVLEHVIRPVDAVRNMATMLNDGGYVVIATPFLFRVHGRPYDYFRWTPRKRTPITVLTSVS